MSNRSTRALLGALLMVLFAGSAVRAQSLGEVAAKEQQRREKERQKNGGSAKVITSDDLRDSGRGTLSNAGSTSGDEGAAAKDAAKDAPKDGAAAAPAKEKTEDEVKAERRADWRKRTQDAAAQVGELTARLAQLQTALNDVNGLYSAGRANVAAEFDKTRADLATAQQKVADLEEEGRRNRY